MSIPDVSPEVPSYDEVIAKRLTPPHLYELAVESAISAEIIAARNYRSVRADQLTKWFAGYQCRDGLLIPIENARGAKVSVQLKPDEPRTGTRGKPIKYETRAGSPLVIDVPSYSRPYIDDPATPLWITEGAKKADSALSNGISCIIALNGVYGWRGTNGKAGKTALPDWEDIALNGRDVVLAFDSDCMTKPQVRSALERLASFLKGRGAEISYCVMPHLPNGEKCGLDDFFAHGGTFDELCACIVEELPPQDDPDAAAQLEPEVVLLEEVTPETIDWLWEGWIPRRMLTILGGYGGDGKSTIMASLIATWTRGGTLPDSTTAPKTKVLMLSAEDDIAYAIRPRLDVHWADPSGVRILKGSRAADGRARWLDLRRDVDVMRRVIAEHEIGLVVIDPLSSYLPNSDRNSEGDIRDALQPLMGLMEETGVAVVGIMHVGKSSDGRRASQRLLGSTAFTALARSVLMVTDIPDEQQPDDAATQGKQKVVQVVKSNYAISPPPLLFRRPLNQAIQWLGESAISIEECFSQSGPGKRGPEASERKEAEMLLLELLSQGPLTIAEVNEAAKQMGVSRSALRRAKSAVGVTAFKQAYDGGWMWKLPPAAQPAQVSA